MCGFVVVDGRDDVGQQKPSRIAGQVDRRRALTGGHWSGNSYLIYIEYILAELIILIITIIKHESKNIQPGWWVTAIAMFIN